MAEFGQFLINKMRSSLEPEDLRILNRNSSCGYGLSTKSENCCSPIKEEDNDAENNNNNNSNNGKKVENKVLFGNVKQIAIDESKIVDKKETKDNISLHEIFERRLDLDGDEDLNACKKPLPMYISSFRKIVDQQNSGSNFGVRTIKWGSYMESWKHLAEKYNQSPPNNKLTDGSEEARNHPKDAEPHLNNNDPCEIASKLNDIRLESRLVSRVLNCKLNVKNSVYKSKRYKPTKFVVESTDEMSSNSQKVTNNPIYISDSRLRFASIYLR